MGSFEYLPEHLPGLIVLVAVSPLLWITLSTLRSMARAGSARATRLLERCDALSFTAKAVLFATLVGALVHAAIIPTHWADERVTAILFIIDAAAFLIAFYWTFTNRNYWRSVAVATTGGTAIAYAIYILCGWETMDLVGLLTTTIEFAATLMVVSPVLSSSPSREHRVALAAIPLALATLLGTGAIAERDDGEHGPVIPRLTRDVIHVYVALSHPVVDQASFAGHNLSGRPDHMARHRHGDGAWHENGHPRLHGSADCGAAASRGLSGRPNSQGHLSVHEFGRREGCWLCPTYTDRAEDRALHQSVHLSPRGETKPRFHSGARVRQYRTWCRPLCCHVPHAARCWNLGSSATRRMLDPVARSHRPLHRGRQSRRYRAKPDHAPREASTELLHR